MQNSRDMFGTKKRTIPIREIDVLEPLEGDHPCSLLPDAQIPRVPEATKAIRNAKVSTDSELEMLIS